MEKIKAFARKNFSPKTVRFLYVVYQKLPNKIKGLLYRWLFNRGEHQPPVSCICPTYGRTDWLEEAIHSFLKQDYRGPKELIILNDFAQQFLIYDHPEVRIINLPKRMHTLGEKFKAAVGLCTYDFIFVWHDDDISLPHRLSYAVKRHYANEPDLKPKKNKSFFSSDKAWIWNGQQLRGLASGRFSGSSSWTRKLFTTVRGYAHINEGYDEEIETQFAKSTRSMHIEEIALQDIYCIQRQSENTSYQLHDFADDGAGNAYDKVADFVQRQAEQGEIKLGRVELEPQWRIDYSKLVRDFLRTKRM